MDTPGTPHQAPPPNTVATPVAPTASASATYPVDVTAVYPERSSRGWAVATLLFFIPKLIGLIPHMIVLYLLGLVMMPVLLIGQIAVLFVGRYPRVLFDFAVSIYRWQMRVNAFLFGLTDSYPPFSLK